ncbi:MAG: DNA primase, partial [Bacteroidales bacterium]|nr:DNA primase [Bacteroidales bacterium]
MIPQYTIDKILEASDIVSIIGSYIKLERKGKDYKACCPFHNEKTPSFSVRAEEQTYKCFGCGEGGNVVNFLMKYEQLNYPEAIKELGRRAGIEIPEVKLSEEDENQFKLQKQIYNANEQAMMYFIKSLTKERNLEYYNYAYSRMSEESIQAFNIGYAPGNLTKHLNSLGFSKDVLVAAGLVTKLHDGAIRDKFYQRLIFPIKDERGLIVGFTGRTLDTNRQDKYNNTPATIVYDKKSILFGLDLAKREIRNTGICYVVEGNMDAITLNSIGVKNVVATSGTALNINQINLIKKFGCKTIVIIPDRDEAGIKALHKNARLFIENQLEVKVIMLPIENEIKTDADSYFKDKDIAFFNQVSKTEYLELFLIENTAGIELTPVDKSKVIKELVSLIACYPSEVAAIYLDMFSKVVKPAKMLNEVYKKELKKRENDIAKKRLEESRKHEDEKRKEILPEKYIQDDSEKREFLSTVLPAGVDVDFYIQYGFYHIKNNYFFECKEEKFFKKSNFILSPIAQIQSS